MTVLIAQFRGVAVLIRLTVLILADLAVQVAEVGDLVHILVDSVHQTEGLSLSLWTS